MDTDLLAELMNRKQDVLEQLRHLSRRQMEFVGDGDISRLLNLLAAKQTLLERLQSLERELDPFRKQEPQARRWRSPQDRLRCQQVSQRCEALLSEIMLIEKQSESDLQARRDEAAARLQGAHSASQAAHAYTRAPTPNAGQLDLTSDS